MIYSIVNAALGKATYNSPEAEDMFATAMGGEACFEVAVCVRIEEVFSPIFFNYQNGLKYRSIWQPCCARQYIPQWHELAQGCAMLLLQSAAAI